MAEVSVGIMAKKLTDPTYTEGRRIISGKLIEKESVLDINSGYNKE
jgi:LacI family transcriptional regulator